MPNLPPPGPTSGPPPKPAGLPPPGGGPPPGGPGGPPPPSGPPSKMLWESLRLLWYFVPFLRPVRWLVVLIIIGTVLNSLVSLPMMFLPAMFTKHFNDRPFLLLWLAFALGAMMLGWVLSTLLSYWSASASERLIRGLRYSVFANFERLNMMAVYEHGPGHFVQQIGRDVVAVRDLFGSTLLRLGQQIGTGASSLIALLALDPVLTIIILAVVGLMTLPIRWINRQVEKRAILGRELMQSIMGQLVENVGGFRDIVAAGRFRRFHERFDELLEAAQRNNVSTSVWAQLSGLVPAIVISLAGMAVYLIGLERYQDVSQVGLILTYAGLLSQMFPAIMAVARTSTDLAMAAPSMRALRELLDQPPLEKKDTIPLVEPIRSIQLERVTLELEGRPIIRNMSFEIPHGKLTAIVGGSGSGKTTIFHLLLQLLEPTSGEILINGTPADGFTLDSLRNRIGFIPQNPFLFNQTLRDNILLASPEQVPPEKMSEVTQLAQLDEVITLRAKEGGLEALAGYMGGRLSAGEKQRIALARLLLRNPEIIICDEYTANVDVKTARLIHDAMRTHFAGLTRVIITHELYTARGAEWIIVIDHGRVVQQGSHEELAASPGLYREMLEVQSVA
jgi:ABC-type multidrug transport system fused ATPase/permease subunit